MHSKLNNFVYKAEIFVISQYIMTLKDGKSLRFTPLE